MVSEQKRSSLLLREGNSDHLVVPLSLLSPRPIAIIGRRRRRSIEEGRRKGGRGSSLSSPRPPKEEERRDRFDPLSCGLVCRGRGKGAAPEYVSTKGFLYPPHLFCLSTQQSVHGFLIGLAYFGSHGMVQMRRRCCDGGDLAGDKKDKRQS